MQDENKVAMTQEQLFDKLIPLYEVIWDAEADIKDLIAQAKEEDTIEDISLINQIAKAKVYRKLTSLEEKSKLILSKIQELQ